MPTPWHGDWVTTGFVWSLISVSNLARPVASTLWRLRLSKIGQYERIFYKIFTVKVTVMLVTKVDSHSHDSWSNFIIFAVVVYKPMSQSDTMNLTFPLQVILTKQRTFITTTTSTTATTTSMTTTTTRRRRWATIGTEARDAYTSRVSGTTVCLFFFTFLNNLLIFFTDWLWTMTTVMTQMTVTTVTTGAWDATASWTPGKFFFFLVFFLFLWLIHIFTVATRTPPSPLLSPPPSLPQNSSQPHKMMKGDQTTEPWFCHLCPRARDVMRLEPQV